MHNIPLLTSFIICIASYSKFVDAATSCVVCDSYTSYGPSCRIWDKYSHIKNCSMEKDIDVKKTIYCRKTEYAVYSDSRVVRYCSNRRSKKKGCFDRVGTHKVKINYCICEGDNCNGGGIITVKAFLETMFAATLVIFSYAYL